MLDCKQEVWLGVQRKIIEINNLHIILFMVCIGFFFCFSSEAGISSLEKKEIRESVSLYKKIEASLSEKDQITLDELLRYGVLKNERLKASFYVWKSSVEQIAKEQSLDDPQISFKTFIEEVETRVGPQKHKYGVSQKVPFFGKLRTKGGIATDVSRQKYANYQKTKLDLFYQITSVYLEYWYLNRSISVTRENENLLIRLEKVAQEKFRNSQKSNQDLLKVQIELGKIVNDLLSLEDYKVPIVARINALLNRDPHAFLGTPVDVEYLLVDLPPEEVVYQVLLKNNPDLKKARQRIEETKKKIRIAKLDYFPDFSIGFDYTQVDEGPLNVSDNGDDAVALMVKVNIPLWFQKQSSQIHSARSQNRAVSSEYTQLMRDLVSKLQMLLFKMRDADRQIRLYKDALIPKTEQSLDATEISYKSGRSDFLSLIEIERELLHFRLSYYRAIRDYEQIKAELEMIIGQPIDLIKEFVNEK